MEFIKTVIEDRIAHIDLDRGKSNAFHTEMLTELEEAILAAEKNPAVEGMILHGKAGFFTAGLDLVTLYRYDESEIRKLFIQFFSTIKTLAKFPKPAVAALSGHSPAGGCVLAICCDYRVMAEGNFIIGLNEIPVGIIVPQSIFNLYSFWIGQAAAYRSLLTGKLFSPSEALAIGLIDEVVPADRIRTASLRKIKTITQFDQPSWKQCKQNFRIPLIAELEKENDTLIDQMLSHWWKPSSRAIVKTIIDNLTQKKS
ncbi:enoyl-CoA hydratase/isomerase family protein [Sphingobacteriaceae bacterium WQ 2009]|uniref:Enoyl-CoA hydratase/isomerase family protein n=1 Tax=Rhinopithecimicrobium faecis TaxID=2820698 RepID=A0A8T4HA71_9SPHI|nr:enoyl-CoA hydratase/isomerase family protein [Sphingobacteriaceae bacterium WQ 2009]